LASDTEIEIDAKGAKMKALLLSLMVVLTCLGMISAAGAQSSAGSGKSTAGSPPPQVCQAIETYVAKIDSAKSKSEPSQRATAYAAAKSELETVLKRYNQTSLFEVASDYAAITEQVVTSDSSTPNLDGLLDKRLTLRASLLEICSSYTISR